MIRSILFLVVLLFQFNLWAGAYPVAVIGGGVAGLNAAYKLHKKGTDYLLFEARDRLGGRVVSYDVPDTKLTVEMGGAFINEGHYFMRNLVHELGVDLIELKKHIDFSYFYTKGSGLGTTRALYKEVGFRAIARKMIHHAHLMKVEENLFESLRFTTKWIYSLSSKEYLDYLEVKSTDDLFKLLKIAVRSEYGDELEKVPAIELLHLTNSFNKNSDPLTGFDVYRSVLYENYIIKGGGRVLIEAFKAKLDENKILLNHEVTKVEKNSDGYLIYAGGTTYQVSKVIFALPIPFLKKLNLVNFDLPSVWRDYMDGVSYGTNMKFFVYFGVPIWSKLYEKNLQFVTDYAWIWDNGDYYYGLPPKKKEFALTAFFGGEDVKFLESLTDAEITEMILTDLEKIFPNIRNYYRGSLRGTAWYKEQFSKGSYSGFLDPKKEHLIEKLEESFKTEKDLFVVGEGWSFDFLGFMEGAVESATRVSLLD